MKSLKHIFPNCNSLITLCYFSQYLLLVTIEPKFLLSIFFSEAVELISCLNDLNDFCIQGLEFSLVMC